MFLEEHGEPEADLGARNAELCNEPAREKQINDQETVGRLQRWRAKIRAQEDEEVVPGIWGFLSDKEWDLIRWTFSNKVKYLTCHDVREAMFYNEEFREMFEELIGREYQGPEVCSSDSVNQH